MDETARKRGYVLDYHKVMAAQDYEGLRATNSIVEAAYLEQRTLVRKTKELILAAGLTAMRASKGHINAALEAGATEREVLEAIEISISEAGIVASQQGFDAWREVTARKA